MPNFIDRVLHWARRFSMTLSDPFPATEVLDAGDSRDDQLIYRLRRWPELPSSSLSTDVTRALSVMSTRPVNRRWLLNNSGLQAHEVDSMLRRLVGQGAVEVTDAGKFQPRPRAA